MNAQNYHSSATQLLHQVFHVGAIFWCNDMGKNAPTSEIPKTTEQEPCMEKNIWVERFQISHPEKNHEQDKLSHGASWATYDAFALMCSTHLP